jgi:hypothetical protein
MLPIRIPGPFLMPNASLATVSQEQELLGRLAAAEPADTFVIADRLQTLYFRNLRSGGTQGRLWLDEFRRNAARVVEEEDRFVDFLRFSESGASLALPPEVTPPPGLRFSQDIGRPSQISLQTTRQPFAHRAFYFHLPELFFEDDLLAPQALEEARKRLDDPKYKCAVQVMRHYRSAQLLVRRDAPLCQALAHAGYAYALGWIGHEDSFPPPPFRVGDLKVGTRPVKDRAWLSPIPPVPFVLGFEPRRNLEFAPLAVTLVRNGQPYPVVIEQQDLEGLLALAPEDLRSEIKDRQSRESSERLSILLAVRSPAGSLEGYALNYLSPDRTSLRCQHALKIDESAETGIRYFGLALTIARLRFMKEKGLWPQEGPVLTHFFSAVSASYKGLLGIPPGALCGLQSSLDGISREEGELFLERNPFHFERAG